MILRHPPPPGSTRSCYSSDQDTGGHGSPSLQVLPYISSGKAQGTLWIGTHTRWRSNFSRSNELQLWRMEISFELYYTCIPMVTLFCPSYTTYNLSSWFLFWDVKDIVMILSINYPTRVLGTTETRNTALEGMEPSGEGGRLGGKVEHKCFNE